MTGNAGTYLKLVATIQLLSSVVLIPVTPSAQTFLCHSLETLRDYTSVDISGQSDGTDDWVFSRVGDFFDASTSSLSVRLARISRT